MLSKCPAEFIDMLPPGAKLICEAKRAVGERRMTDAVALYTQAATEYSVSVCLLSVV
jgi:hypothetical protein